MARPMWDVNRRRSSTPAPRRRSDSRHAIGNHQAGDRICERYGDTRAIRRDAEGFDGHVRIETRQFPAGLGCVLPRNELLNKDTTQALLILSDERYGTSVRHPSNFAINMKFEWDRRTVHNANETPAVYGPVRSILSIR